MTDNFAEKESMLWIVQNINTFYKYCNGFIKCFFFIVYFAIYFPQNRCIGANVFSRVTSDNSSLIKFLCYRKIFLPSFRKNTIYKIISEFPCRSIAFLIDLLFQSFGLDIFQIQYTFKTLVMKLFTMTSS